MRKIVLACCGLSLCLALAYGQEPTPAPTWTPEPTPTPGPTPVVSYSLRGAAPSMGGATRMASDNYDTHMTLTLQPAGEMAVVVPQVTVTPDADPNTLQIIMRPPNSVGTLRLLAGEVFPRFPRRVTFPNLTGPQWTGGEGFLLWTK